MNTGTQVQPSGAVTAPAPEKKNPILTLLMIPAVGSLFIWMIVPLVMTIIYSFIRYNLMKPEVSGFAGFENYSYLAGDESFFPAIINTIVLMGSVLIITVVLGTLLAVLFDREFFGKNIATLFVIAPFFVMPTVSVLIWKNMIMDPVNGLVATWLKTLGLPPIDWFGNYPMLSIITIVSWEWLPFAFLILFTSLKSLDQEQKEAAAIDGAGHLQSFFYIVVPHLQRAIGVVVMMETIFLLSLFAEIFISTKGGPGSATTNLAFLIYSLGLGQFDIGVASAGGILAVILANIVATFMVRLLAQNLKGK
jgi:sorbitol/mannitol transport system permease protein